MIDWTVVQGVAAVVQSVAAIATVAVATAGILYVVRQIKQVERTIVGATYERLTAESIEILRFLAEEPASYPYFYEGKELEENSPHRVFVLYAVEAIANYLEHVCLQSINMTKGDWRVWDDFLVDTLRNSPTIRNHLKRRKNWYMEFLVEVSERVSKTLEPKSAVGVDASK